MDQQAYWAAVQYIESLDKRYKLNKRAGWVYAFTNPGFKTRMYKIGETSKPPLIRLQDLSRETGVPTPYQAVYFVHVLDRNEAEKFVHRRLSEYRVADNKEFFAAPVAVIVSALEKAAEAFPNYGCKNSRTLLLPQVFRHGSVKCPNCSMMNRVRELAVEVQRKCSECGTVLEFDFSS